MAYTDETHITMSISSRVLASLLDDTNSPPSLASANAQAVLAQLIADADRWVNSYVAKVLTTPISDANLVADLELASRMHVVFHAYGRRGRGSENPADAQYKATERWLRAIQRGDIVLTDTGGVDHRLPRTLIVYQSDTTDSRPKFDLHSSPWKDY